MSKVIYTAILGMIAGDILAMILLGGAVVVLRAGPNEPALALEHWVIYFSLILGAGFGSVCGALAGLAGALIEAQQGHSHHPPVSEVPSRSQTGEGRDAARQSTPPAG
jgi:hypothetical protein